MTTAAEPRFVDTCVLLDATDVARARHARSIARLDEPRRWVTSAQVAREYLAVATRPVSANGLGMSMADGLENLRAFRVGIALLPEEKPVLPSLLRLLGEVPCSGRVVFDASIVATMLVHGVGTILTANPADFARLGRRIAVEALD